MSNSSTQLKESWANFHSKQQIIQLQNIASKQPLTWTPNAKNVKLSRLLRPYKTKKDPNQLKIGRKLVSQRNYYRLLICNYECTSLLNCINQQHAFNQIRCQFKHSHIKHIQAYKNMKNGFFGSRLNTIMQRTLRLMFYTNVIKSLKPFFVKHAN